MGTVLNLSTHSDSVRRTIYINYNSSPELSITTAPLASARAARIAAAARAPGGVACASSRGRESPPRDGVLRRGGGGALVEPGDPSET